MSRRVWNISREGDSTASLGSLFQCSVTLRGKKFFLMFFLTRLTTDPAAVACWVAVQQLDTGRSQMEDVFELQMPLQIQLGQE